MTWAQTKHGVVPIPVIDAMLHYPSTVCPEKKLFLAARFVEKLGAYRGICACARWWYEDSTTRGPGEGCPPCTFFPFWAKTFSPGAELFPPLGRLCLAQVAENHNMEREVHKPTRQTQCYISFTQTSPKIYHPPKLATLTVFDQSLIHTIHHYP